MLIFNYYIIIFILSAISVQKVQSAEEISAQNIEYANLRIAQRQRALQSLSLPQFKFETKRKSWIKQLQLQNDDENENKYEKDLTQITKKVKKTLCNQPQADKENILQKQAKDVEEKPIIENGVNQPHNHENQQNLTVNQAKEKQQLSQHHFKLLNVVKPRNKRQIPAVTSNGNNYNNYYNNNNGNSNQQQFTTYSIQYYPTNQLQQQQELQEQQQQFQLPPSQQYQLQYFQQPTQPTITPIQSHQQQQQFQQNFNNIEVIVNGNSLSTIPQKTTATLTQSLPIVNVQQQSQSIPILITLSTTTTTPKPQIAIPTIKTTTSIPSLPPATISSISENSFKPFLPLEIIKDYNEGPTTPPPPTVCKICCIPNEQPCSKCCDGNPLLNAQTLKTLGG